MKKISILFSIIIILTTACNKDEDDNVIDEQPTESRSVITYSGDVTDVSVLIFKKDNNQYLYHDKIESGWINNKVSKNLKLGTYKFFYSKFKKVNSSFSTSMVEQNTEFDNVDIVALDDTQPGYIKEVDEVWLPDTEQIAGTPQAIIGDSNDYVFRSLTRAVSQAEVILKRGYENSEGGFSELPYPDGKSIADEIETITLDIKGVGKALTAGGSSKGSANMVYTIDDTGTPLTGGFRQYTGPFVFPNETKVNSQIEVRVEPKSTSKYSEMSTEVSGLFERNKKLKITIWLTATYELIKVTVNTEKISATEDGDKGIWD